MAGDLLLYAIKRKRTSSYSGTERWVEIGRCAVNRDGLSGFIELHANNETWRLFPHEKREKAKKTSEST